MSQPPRGRAAEEACLQSTQKGGQDGALFSGYGAAVPGGLMDGFGRHRGRWAGSGGWRELWSMRGRVTW